MSEVPVDDAKLVMLTSMGFDIGMATAALRACNGDVERAIEHCLGGGAGGGEGECFDTSSTSASVAAAASSSLSVSSGRIVHLSNVSQYTANGRSACTCIALCCADRFLRNVSNKEADTLDCSFLTDEVMRGIQVYSAIKSRASGGVEHMSVEEVLNSTAGMEAFASLSLCGSVRQGVLSSDVSGPLGLRAVLHGCQIDGSIDTRKWTAVAITKSPETVVVLLPPSASPKASDGTYILIDSHPRPQLAADGSYVMAHENLDLLVQTLESIFPCTDLGDDVGDMMQMMYNSFDAYALQA